MKNKYYPPIDRFCPMCAVGSIESHNIKVCSTCQADLMPEEDDNEEPIVHQSINDPSGFVHQIF